MDIGKVFQVIANFFKENPGDRFATYLSLLFTLIGFAITIGNIGKARKETRTVIENLKDDFKKFDTISDLTEALSIMDEIKQHHRDDERKVLLIKYSSLSKLLIRIGTTHPDINDDQKTILQSAKVSIHQSEELIEKSISNPNAIINVPKMNKILTMNIDKLFEMLVQLRNRIGEENDK